MNTENITKIHDIYVDVLKNGNDVYKNNNGSSNDDYLCKLKATMVYLTEMNKKLMNIIDLSEILLNGCKDRISEVKKELYLGEKYKNHINKDILIFKEINNGMKWGDISDIEDKKEKIINDVDFFINNKISSTEYTKKDQMYKTLNKIYNVKLDFNFKLPIIAEITDIPPSLYWYNGDAKYSEGIYMTLNDGVFIKVPFPDTIDYLNSHTKKNTIKCKNKTHEECKMFRDSINKYNTYVPKCNYLHIGDKFLKINNMVRCSSNSHFGKHSYLNKDLANMAYSDIQSIILYSISDILLNSLWIQKQKKIGNIKNTIIDDIEISL